MVKSLLPQTSLARVEAALVDVGDGDQFDAAGSERVAGVAAALRIRSDQRDADAVVGRDALRRLGHDFSSHTRRRATWRPGNDAWWLPC